MALATLTYAYPDGTMRRTFTDNSEQYYLMNGFIIIDHSAGKIICSRPIGELEFSNIYPYDIIIDENVITRFHRSDRPCDCKNCCTKHFQCVKLIDKTVDELKSGDI
jgi:hypothetical protein